MMGVMCKVGKNGYSLNDQCGGGSSSGGKWKEKKGREKTKKEEKLGVEKRKWSKRGLIKLIFAQNGRGI